MKKFDCIVIGGSIGGVLATYSLVKNGHNVLLIEETDWIGGQLTSQGVPSDEHDFIEKTGSSKSYREFRNKARDYYRNHPNIKDEYKTKDIFNPGGGWVSRNAFEPKLALKLFNEMLEPYIKKGNLKVVLEARVINSNYDDKKIYHIEVKQNDELFKFEADYFIDSTDNGDFLPLSGTNYVIGAESYEEFKEPNAPKEARPHDMQPITWIAAIAYEEGGNNLIKKPAMYDLYKNCFLPFNEPILSWYAAGLEKNTTKRLFSLFATKGSKFENTPSMFPYRQIFNPRIFKNQEGLLPITLLNWQQNDYIMGNIIENEDIDFHKYAAKQLTLSLIYWLQTEAERCDGKGFGYPEIKLSKETLGTEDGLAKAPYIRESRRIKALYTVTEQDISREYSTKKPKYEDSVGIGLYNIDLHMTTETGTHFFEKTWPFEIPLGSLIPNNRTNLIAGCKNIGTTHITNGCYRTHPVEWNIGESAGYLVSYLLKNNLNSHELYNNKEEIKKFQKELKENGIELSWPNYVFEELT